MKTNIGHNNPPLDPKETIQNNINRKKPILDRDPQYFNKIPLPSWIELSLIDVCNRHKWQITEVYEETISGTKGVDERYELNRMMHDACLKKFDKVVVWSVDRLGRSMNHLVSVLSQLDELNVDVFSYVQGIDTSTQFGKSMFQMVGIFAELENNMRKERQSIGIKRALDNGAKFGRKSIMNDELIKKINNLREEGHSMRNIANECDVSTTIVQKAIKNTVRNTNSRVI